MVSTERSYESGEGPQNILPQLSALKMATEDLVEG